MTTADFLSYLRSLDVKVWVENGEVIFNAPKGVLTPVLRAELTERKAKILAFLHSIASATRFAESPLQGISRDGKLPLSFAQERLWFLDQLEPGNSAYHMPMAMRLRGDLERDALERAINAIVARHESLRTHFVEVEGEPAQVVEQALKIALPMEDLSALEEGAREAAIAAALQREREAPFNLNQGPLLRTTLLKLGKREHILLRVCHHIVSDGWSTSVFNRELATLYEAFCAGRDNPLEPLAVQYPDYALWQRRWLQGEALEHLLAYWTNKLEGAPPLLALPTDRPRTTNRSNRAESRTLDLPEELAASLSAMCQRARVTLFMALLAGFKVLLARYSGQEDIVIGTPIAVRNHVAIEGLIGFFLSTIALRTDLSGNPTFEELLKRVRTTALEAYAHQDLPFEKLIERINPERNLSHTPVFQVLFNMQNFKEVPPSFAGLEVERLALPDPDAKFDLTLYAMEVRGRLRFRAVYNTDLFDGARIERMLDQWQHLLTQVAENPNRPIHDYSLVTGKTMRLLPDPAIALSVPFGVPVFRQFLAAAQVNAAQSAVRHEDQDWTYQQLEDASKRIAKQLVARGVRSGEVVVVSGQRSFGLVASILGVLGARGIFLLIDPSLPSTRRDLMLQEARGAHWLHVGDGHDADGNWSAAFRGLLTTRISCGGFCLDSSTEAAMEDVALVDAAPDEAAYIFFTSGTTGKPKAIVGSHKGLSHFIDWERQILGVVQSDRVAQLTGMSFDVVLRDIFLPLTSGATLCLPRPEIVSQGDQLVSWLRREGITILHAVPSLAHAWLDSLVSASHVPTLRWVLFAGEPLTGQLIFQWRKHIGGAGGMINLYGPTETTLAKCFHVLPANPGVGIQPIGRPLPCTQALVLSQGGQLCGIGEPGEIVIRTPFRTLGYLNGSDSDRARFAPNPFRDDPTDVVYRTGDIGAYDNQGQLIISGRLDDQIKIRGSRVEPAEINATLDQHPDVQHCAVVARENGSRDKSLVAYVVQRPNCAFAGAIALRTFLKRSLPDYMIPAAFVVLDKLPLTPNGKLDSKALPAPDNIRSHLAPDYVGPRNSAEQTLVTVWRELLKLDEVGVHDDFFELGGHSLIATRLASQIRKDFNIEIPLRAIFENPTIDGLARRILELQAATMDSDEMEELIKELEALPEENAQSRAREIKETRYPLPAPEKETSI